MPMIKITREVINDALRDAEVVDRIQPDDQPLNGITRLIEQLCDDISVPDSGLSHAEYYRRICVLWTIRSVLSSGAGAAMNKALQQAGVAGKIEDGEHPAEGLERIYHEVCDRMEKPDTDLTEQEFRRQIFTIKDFRKHLSPEPWNF